MIHSWWKYIANKALLPAACIAGAVLAFLCLKANGVV